MEIVRDLWRDVRSLKSRRGLHQLVSLGLVVCSALMIWKGLIVVTGCESPVVVVLTGSMLPGIRRGDLLILTHDKAYRPDVGEIVVFRVRGKDIPIVHRALESHDGFILTKGDHNPVDDRGLYQADWLRTEDMIGHAVAHVPSVGYVTILLNENPRFRAIVLGFFAILVLLGRD